MVKIKYSHMIEIWGFDGGGTASFKTKKDATAYMNGLIKEYKARGYRLQKYEDSEGISYADIEDGENRVIYSRWEVE